LLTLLVVLYVAETMFYFTLDRFNSYRKRVLSCVPISFMLVFSGRETACLPALPAFSRGYSLVFIVLLS